MYQETQNTIAEYKKGGAATDELEEELRIIEEFMPIFLGYFLNLPEIYFSSWPCRWTFISITDSNYSCNMISGS